MESHVKNNARVLLAHPTSVKRAISQSGCSSQCMQQKASLTDDIGKGVTESCNKGVTYENGEPHYTSSVPQTKVFEALYEISFAGALVHRYLKIRFPERQSTECLVVLRDSVQVARLIILLGESRLMACPIDANTILMAHRADTLRTPEDFSSLWFLQYGYKLPPEATKTIVKVSFGYLTLHYPVGCCWRSKLIELPHITSDIRRIIATNVFKSCSDLRVIGDASIRLLSMRQSLQVSAACLEHARNLLRTIEPNPDSDVSRARDTPWEREGEACYLENQSETDAFEKLNMKLEHRREAPVVLPVRPPHHCLIERERPCYSVPLLPITEQLESFNILEGDHVLSNGSAFTKDDSVADSIAKRSRRILPPLGTYGVGNRTNYLPIDRAQNRKALTRDSSLLSLRMIRPLF
uniref:Uncharacterized protein n=1 Tax=Toxoplasma gondii (strain ATCC 50861 / VEG) TaxID=432359 RepID=A0A0F7UVU7_TOXGV|nr:TPA: hypothetical protein BN1205_010120 [Toxoplasma gondii VEG]